MAADPSTRLPQVIDQHHSQILADWLAQQTAVAAAVRGGGKEGELREQCAEFLRLFQDTLKQGGRADVTGAAWAGVRAMLDDLTRARAAEGFTPTQTAMFVFSFKKPLFAALQRELGGDGKALSAEMWLATEILDGLGLHTTDVFQRSREEVIGRQQTEMMELSTPVVKLWDGILALPLIGTLDSARTPVIMENLLQKIVDTEASVAILDITGVPTVDTLVAQHLLKTVTAARLMGADCIISGISAQIAQTIVHLGVNLGDVITKATLADALALALKRRGLAVTRARAAEAG
jgi:rsbT co-antagonist protein RsbR